MEQPPSCSGLFHERSAPSFISPPPAPPPAATVAVAAVTLPGGDGRSLTDNSKEAVAAPLSLVAVTV